MNITNLLKLWVQKHYKLESIPSDENTERLAKACLANGELTQEKCDELCKEVAEPGTATLTKLVKSAVADAMNGNNSSRRSASIGTKIYGGSGNGSSIRVKDSSESYSTTKAVGAHVKTGQPVSLKGQQVLLPSQLETAKAGVLFRHLALRSGMQIRPLDDHEKGLLDECFDDDWCGEIGGDHYDRIRGSDAKALISDATSGGLYVNPIWFDDLLVTFPLLHSELMPFVEVRDMPRSNRVEAASMANPTVSWGTSEGTAITPFTTTGLVAAINSSTFPVQVAVEVGRDLLSDAAVDVGGELQTAIGQRMATELDLVIAVGNGTTQPQGLTNATGFNTINTDNGPAGPLTVADAESLIFGVGKQYRNPSWNPSFVMNDTSYSRFRGVPVSGTDERRVFGLDQQSYSLLEYPTRISNNMSNNDIAFLPLRKYRLYRRSGNEIMFTQEGNYLALRNLALFMVRGRYGGKLMDAASMAFAQDAQS